MLKDFDLVVRQRSFWRVPTSPCSPSSTTSSGSTTLPSLMLYVFTIHIFKLTHTWVDFIYKYTQMCWKYFSTLDPNCIEVPSYTITAKKYFPIIYVNQAVIKKRWQSGIFVIFSDSRLKTKWKNPRK